MLAVVATVPAVGNVREVGPDSVHVVGYAPVIVVVLAALLASPVPPSAGPTTVNPLASDPDASAPTEVKDEPVTVLASVEPVKSRALTIEAMSAFSSPSVCTPTIRELALPCGMTAVRPAEPYDPVAVEAVAAVSAVAGLNEYP